MTDRTLRLVVIALAAMLVVVLAATAVVISGRDDGAGSPSSAPTAAGSASPSPPPSEAATATPSDGATPTAEPSIEASPSPSPSGSPGLPQPASLTLLEMKLDAATDPDGTTRVITFRSDGPGVVTARLASVTPQGTTHMCLKLGSTDIACDDLASGTFTGRTRQDHATWKVTLRGTDVAAPVVNVTVTFEAAAPAVTIRKARFDGTDFAETNGIQARFTAREAGEATVSASWGGHPFRYEIDLFDETGGSGDTTLADQGPSIDVTESLAVTPGDWRLLLQNIDEGFGATELTATISWP